MTDPLTLLAIRVLDAKVARRKAAEARCCASPEDTEECDRLDDISEGARVDLEHALWMFFQCWLDIEIAEQTERDASEHTGARE